MSHVTPMQRHGTYQNESCHSDKKEKKNVRRIKESCHAFKCVQLMSLATVKPRHIHCNTLQHADSTATHCNTLQHAVTHELSHRDVTRMY